MHDYLKKKFALWSKGLWQTRVDNFKETFDSFTWEEIAAQHEKHFEWDLSDVAEVHLYYDTHFGDTSDFNKWGGQSLPVFLLPLYG